MTGEGAYDVRVLAGPCPACGAHAARPVLYGMPDPEAFERLSEQVVFAGCLVPEVAHPYACAVCGARWGAGS